MLRQDQGAKIRMFRLEFSFNNNEHHQSALHRWISQAISKGAERIELLLAPEHPSFYTRAQGRSKFPFTLPPGTESGSSLKYLHLQYCNLLVKFDGFKELKNLVLDKITLDHDQILCLLSECINLEELTIMNCFFVNELHLISPTLHQLSILNCRGKISIDTLSLSSFDHRGKIRNIRSIKAPQLLIFCFSMGDVKEMKHAFQLVASLQQLQNLTLSLSKYGIADVNYSCDLRRKTYPAICHNELKYVEINGYKGRYMETKIANHVLETVTGLEQVTLNPGGRVYRGGGKWEPANQQS